MPPRQPRQTATKDTIDDPTRTRTPEGNPVLTLLAISKDPKNPNRKQARNILSAKLVRYLTACYMANDYRRNLGEYIPDDGLVPCFET